MLLVALLLFPGPLLGVPELEPGGGFVGLTLEQALFRLQGQGLHLVFTSELVRPEMEVLAEPRASDPRRILDELLAPHGLEAEDRAGGTVVVVAAPREALSGLRVRGTVRSRSTGEPVAGATIQVHPTASEDEGTPSAGTARSDAAGRYEVRGLTPGIYRLEARLPQFLPEEAHGVVVSAGRPADVDLALRPLPFVEEEIVVRPSRLSLLHEEPDAPLSLSRRDIENLPHLARDVLRALTLFPGVAGNDISAELRIHGGRRDETQILLDGQELYDAFHLKDFDNAASIVASQGLDGVSLSTGAFGADRGDRMSGIVDMRTRSPSGPLHTELGLSLTEAYALSGGGLGNDRGGWLVSGRRGFIDVAGRVLGDEDPSFWDLFAKVERRLGERHLVRAHGLRADDELDFFRTLGGVSERFDTGYDAEYLWTTHQAGFGDRGLVTTSGSWSRLDRDREGGESDEDEGFEVFDRRDTEILGLQQDWDWQTAAESTWKHAMSWGFQVRRYDTRYDYFNDFVLDEVDFNTPLSRPPVPRFRDEFRGEHVGIYVSDRFSPVERLTVELGLRSDRHTLTDDTLTSPRVHLAWRLGDRQVLRAAWGHYFQSQRPYELQVEDGETSFFPAERSEHWVLGYEALLGVRDTAPLHALRIEAYLRDIRDPRPRFENLFEAFSSFPEVEADRVQIVPESSRSVGLEAVLRGAAGGGARWWANYAYSEAEDVVDGVDVLRRIDQTHSLNLHFEQPLGRQWHLNLAWRFHTGRPTTPVFLVIEDQEEPDDPLEGEGEEGGGGDEEGEDGPRLSFGLGPRNSERLSNYHRLDLRASRSWKLHRGELTFFVDVQNVYDRRNHSGTDFEIDEEREILIRKREAWPGILPSVGLRWKL